LTSTKRVNGRKLRGQEVEKRRKRSRSTTVNRGTEAKAKAEEAPAGDFDRIVTESVLLVAKEAKAEVEAAGPTPDPVGPTEAKASLRGTTQAAILVETRTTVGDKTTRATAADSTNHRKGIKKPRPIAWPGLFVCCL